MFLYDKRKVIEITTFLLEKIKNVFTSLKEMISPIDLDKKEIDVLKKEIIDEVLKEPVIPEEVFISFYGVRGPTIDKLTSYGDRELIHLLKYFFKNKEDLIKDKSWRLVPIIVQILNWRGYDMSMRDWEEMLKPHLNKIGVKTLKYMETVRSFQKRR